MSVHNGESWRNYGVLDGPLGERVFDIAADPRPSPDGGDVWIAGSRGLARYHLEEDRWSYLTRADGLPSDQVEALAFAPDGTLYAGTQCDGLSIARPADDYATWETTTAPRADRIETEPVGAGLPSDQFNDLLVHSGGTVYAATVRGLARSTDGGASWSYTRGRDYADKVKRRFEGPPPRWQPVNKEAMRRLLPEDYVTTLAEAPDGKLWIGFRQHGLMAFDPATGATEEVRAKGSDLPEDFVTGLVPMAGEAWAGTYGGGVVRLETASPSAEMALPLDQLTAATLDLPPNPSPATPPNEERLEALTDRLAALSEELPEQWSVHIGEDWQTKGDWVGRLGRQHTVLCAMGAPLDHHLYYSQDFKVTPQIGPHTRGEDRLRRWVHRLRWDDRRVLYDPTLGYRRQASWDDHAEAYPMSFEGPDVWVSIEVPAGLHRVTLYFFNKDGHHGRNRYRDYLLEVKPHVPSLEAADKKPSLAIARVREFWGGTHELFAVKGPSSYLVKIGCNDSFNTVVSGVFVDAVDGYESRFDRLALPWMGGQKYRPPTFLKAGGDAGASENRSALAVGKAVEHERVLSDALRQVGGVEHSVAARLLAYRAISAEAVPDGPSAIRECLLKRWRWQLRLWEPDTRAEFDAHMRRAWEAMCVMNPGLRHSDPHENEG